jgi:hypothetical protein
MEGVAANVEEAAKRAMFLELTQVCLWGNSTDLSLLIDVSTFFLVRLRITDLTPRIHTAHSFAR